MKGVITNQSGELIYTDVEDVRLSDQEVLIDVYASAVNRLDLIQRKNHSSYVENPVLGVEVAGVIKDPNGHPHLNKGDRVMGLVNGGGYAERVAMPVDRVMKIPENLSFEQAAAIPEVFLTAYQTLYWIGELQQKEKVLVHAGGSGVGTAAIQLARQLSDAEIFVTAGTQEKLSVCKDLGADHLINYKTENFADEVHRITNKTGVNVILDFVGASYWEKNYESMAIDGRWVLIGVLGGMTVENINLMKLMQKRIQLTGTLLTQRSDVYKSELSKEFIERTFDLFKSGMLKPVVDTVFPIEEADASHQYMEANKNTGKIILKVK